MQTFLPYPDFRRSAEVLDRQRLGKQRVEAFQILSCIYLKRETGWSNHPATKMWRGYEPALEEYLSVMIGEWERRGYKNTIRRQPPTFAFEMPWWFGDEMFHKSHRQNLTRKMPEHYGKFWKEQPLSGYWWPVGEGEFAFKGVK